MMLPYDKTLPRYIEPTVLPQNVQGYAYCHWWKQSRDKNITAIVLGHRVTIFVTKMGHFGFNIGGDFSQYFYKTRSEAVYRALIIVSNKGEHPSTKSQQASIEYINERMQAAKEPYDTMIDRVQQDYKRKKERILNSEWKRTKSGTIMCEYNKHILVVFRVMRDSIVSYAYSVDGIINDVYYELESMAQSSMCDYVIISGKADE